MGFLSYLLMYCMTRVVSLPDHQILTRFMIFWEVFISIKCAFSRTFSKCHIHKRATLNFFLRWPWFYLIPFYSLCVQLCAIDRSIYQSTCSRCMCVVLACVPSRFEAESVSECFEMRFFCLQKTWIVHENKFSYAIDLWATEQCIRRFW